METVLVTGGAGYIGSILVRKLLQKGYKVRVLDKFLFGIESLKEISANPNLKIIVGDIRNINDVKPAVTGVDHIVHLAAIVGDPACAVQADAAVETNLISTIRLAQLSKNIPGKFIFASTCSVYGKTDGEATEDSPTNPLSLYAETKLKSEKALLQMYDTKELSPVILRFSTIHGLSPRMRFDLVVNFFVKKALMDGKITVFGGEQWRPFIHVADVAEALLMSIEADKDLVIGEIFNVGDKTENYTIKQVADIVSKNTGANVEIIKDMKDARDYKVNFDKISRILNFHRNTDVQNSVKEMIGAIKSKKITNPNDPKYYNYHP